MRGEGVGPKDEGARVRGGPEGKGAGLRVEEFAKILTPLGAARLWEL